MGLLSPFVINLESPYIIVSASGCWGGKDYRGKDITPKDAEIYNCNKGFLDQLIKETNPSVVIFMGTVGMTAVLKEHAPKTLGKAVGDPIKFPELDYWILGTYDSDAHMSGRRDLVPEYMRVFQLANKLAKGDYNNEIVEYELVTTTKRLKELARSLQEKICLDTEDDHWGIGPKPTVYHPNVNMILLQITEKVGEDYKTYVFVPELLSRENIISLIKDRVLIGHNVKYDIQSLWAIKRVNAFRYIRGFARGYNTFGFVCTFLQFVAMDQGYMANSLKKRSEMHFNITPYNSTLEQDLEKMNKAIADSHALLQGLIHEHEKVLKEINQNLEKAASEETPIPKKRPTAKSKAAKVQVVYDLEKLSQELEEYKEQKALLRPLNSANYGDVNTDVLHYYGACDTYYDYRLEDQVLPQYYERGAINPLAVELNYRNVYTFCHVERWGLPIDMNRHRILNEIIDDKVKNIKDWLITNPLVQTALSRVKEIIKLAEKDAKRRKGTPPKLTYDYLYNEAIKPNKKGFLAQLLLVTNVITDSSPRTKSGMEYKLDDSVLEDISGGDDDTNPTMRMGSWTHSDKKNEVQWVWFMISRYRKLLDLQRKFLVQLGQFAVDDRLHPDFHLAKVETGSGSKGTITGRVATTKPNLLAVKKDKALRCIFKAILNKDIDSETNKEHLIQLVNVVHDSLLFIVKRSFLEKALEKIHAVLNDMSLLPFPFDINMRHTCKVGDTMASIEDYDDWVKMGSPVSEDDCVFVECDFSSQEPVVMAVVTRCKEWIYIFENGLDLYACIANDIFDGGIDIHGPDIDDVRRRLTEKYPKKPKDPNNEKEVAKCAIRDDTKTSTLAIAYGQSEYEFALRTGIPKDKVAFFFKTFDRKYPEIRAFKDNIRTLVRGGQMVETLFGYKRSTFLQKTGDWKKDVRNFNRMCRQLGNFLIQQPGFGITATLGHFLVRWILEDF